MSASSFSLRVMPVRLMRKSDAAHYCARSVKSFEGSCPVQPITMANGDRLWDVHDLDAWIDSLKIGAAEDDEILAKLG